jgi:hypothetical protein
MRRLDTSVPCRSSARGPGSQGPSHWSQPPTSVITAMGYQNGTRMTHHMYMWLTYLTRVPCISSMSDCSCSRPSEA